MNNLVYRFLKKYKFLPEETFVKFHYKHLTGKKLNLDEPKDFNEKIQWLKVYYKPPILTQLVDKYAVRSYIAENGGAQYLNKVYGVYENENEIDFEKLPNQFVLKATHGYNMNIVVKDKKQLDVERARRIASSWLGFNHYNTGLEWAYKNVEPRLIAEEYLQEEDKGYITDYKFFCFNGVPKFLKIDKDRHGAHDRFYYDMNWNKLPFTKKGNISHGESIEKPENFKEMVQLARDLSRDFPFVRVDLYNLEGKIIFGEMTFYPADGRTEFHPSCYNTIIGSYMNLPEIPEGCKEITSLESKLQANIL